MRERMWLGFFIILISLGGSICEDEEKCNVRDLGQACDSSDIPSSLPQNGDELLKSCRALERRINCIAGEAETCPEEDEDRKFVKKVDSYLQTLCQEDNPKLKVISDNLQCVTSVARRMGFVCADSISQKNREVIRGIFAKFEAADLHRCLFHKIQLSCQNAKFKRHCGEEVSHAIEDVSINFWLAEGLRKCTPEYLEQIETYKDVYETAFAEEMELEEALKKRRK